MLPGSIRPCSRNDRRNMFVAPATPAVTGPTLTSSTGAGHTQNTTVRGEWRADELFNLFYSVNIDVNRFECWYRVCIWAGRRSTAAGQPIRGIQPARVTRPPRPMGTVCSPCSLGLTWWRLLNKDGNKHLICSSKTSETLSCSVWDECVAHVECFLGNTAVVNRKCALCPLLHCTTPVTTVTR